MICGDLEDPRGILKAVDFVQYDSVNPEALQEALRVLHHPTDPGQLTVEILNIGQRTAEYGLSYTSNSGQPDNGFLAPRKVDQSKPKLSIYHMPVLLRIVPLNANRNSLGPSPKYLQDWGGHQGAGGDSRGLETAR
jgi:hypothetical protein